MHRKTLCLTAAAILLAAPPQSRALAQEATPVSAVTVPEGFRVELLYSVPGPEQGSWVSMTVDPRGRLIVSDQYGKLYRVTPPPIGQSQPTKVEPIDIDLGTAQGLLCALDSLFVSVNGRNSGLYRVQDTDGDDRYDQVTSLRRYRGGGEHGPHAVILSPDGKSLYVCAGNHTDLPDPERSRAPWNWDEDQLLPRMWDAGGHAVGKLAPGGWICKTDPDGKQFELIGSGFRNEYDIAFNAVGELFTYDADMEWDVGAPWYRPTRVNHVSSGAEFGWRSGTGKWPVWSCDSLPSVVDIGPGSPTGITFGTGARFPAKFQRALFISDWSYGMIYAVHLTPQGSTYVGEAERFCSASPLPVTDLTVNPHDGAFYFTIGGRRTQSGLYRITYVGDESTAPASEDATGAEARATRHQLEALHGRKDAGNVDQAWPYLDHPDRYTRFAARIALENAPLEAWGQRALTETSPHKRLTALLALTRTGDGEWQSRVLDSLDQIAWSDLDEQEQLALCRVYGLAYIRLGAPDQAQREAAIAKFSPLFPASEVRLNRELCTLLAYLEAPGVVPRTLELLAAAPTQEEQIHYVYCLRPVKSGWTMEQRQQYFGWFQRIGAGYAGGHSFSGFLANIRKEAIANLTPQDKDQLAPWLKAPREAAEPVAPPRAFVRKWTLDELLPVLQENPQPRNLQRGKDLFAAANCFKCHRFRGEGGISGPDLTALSGRYNNRTLLESLIEPSRVVSDQYQATQFLLHDGRSISGRVVNLSGQDLMVMTDMLKPGEMSVVRRNNIEQMAPSPTSMMPTGLLDTLTQEEILDLIAYLKSGTQAVSVEAKP